LFLDTTKARLKSSLLKLWVTGAEACLSTPKYEKLEQVRHLHRCLKFLAFNGVDGDILEFGVSSGRTLLILDRLAARIRAKGNRDYRIFGFDSFEGLPEPHGADRDYHGNDRAPGARFVKGRFAASKEDVQALLKRRGADISRVQLVGGWFDRVLTPTLKDELKLKSASLINIDCDFYESTVPVLDWIGPLIKQGTIISFDDWFCYKGSAKHGERRALEEFLQRNPSLDAVPFSSYSWHGMSFIMDRCAANQRRSGVVLPWPQEGEFRRLAYEHAAVVGAGLESTRASGPPTTSFRKASCAAQASPGPRSRRPPTSGSG
jgi:hypothetical protein